MQRRKLTISRALVVPIALVAILALAACGSSNKKSTSSSTAASSTPASTASTATSSSTSTGSSSAPAGPAFKVGVICSCSGTIASSLGRAGKVMNAWASTVNASGGLNGHPVSVVVEDDANSPTQAALAGKKIIAAKVQAVVDASAQDPGFAMELAKAGIPVTGGIAYSAPMFTNPNFFPSGAVIPNVILGQVLEAKAAGKKNMGVPYCKETPACAQLVGLVTAAGAVAGGFKATGEAVSFTQPSFVAPCLAMKSAGVDNLFSAVIAPVVVRIAQDCAQQGFKPLQVNQSTTASASWLKAPAMVGTLLADAQAPWFATSIPAVKAFTDALNKYASGVTTDPGFGPDDLSPWTGAKLFEAAVKAGNLTPTSTPADVTAALYTLKNETLGGLSGPLNYTKGQPAFPACYFVAGVASGKFTTPKGTNYICPTAAQVKQLATILAKAA